MHAQPHQAQVYSVVKEVVGGTFTFGLFFWLMAMAMAVGARTEDPYAYVPGWIFAPIQWLVGM